MKTVVYKKYGSPDVVEFREMPVPVPKENEVLIKIHAAVVTPSDCAFRKADPFAIRLVGGLLKPKYAPGCELSGEIVSIGKNVQLFKVGEQVFGSAGTGFGAHAEYKCLPESGVLALKPSNMTYTESVAIADGALTALLFLRDRGKIKSGQKVLINGASGAVGAYAVQLAKHYGANVTAVCSAGNELLVRSLGADEVIDYTTVDFTKTVGSYDLIFDAVGKSSFSRCRQLLAPKGVYMGTVPKPGLFLQMLLTSRSRGKKAIFSATGLNQRPENVAFLQELAEAGKIKPVIDRTYELENIAEAHRYVELGHKKGNVVITVGEH